MYKYLLFSFFLFLLSSTLWATNDRQSRAEKQRAKEQQWTLDATSYLQRAKLDSFLYVPVSKAKLDTLFYAKRKVYVAFSEEFAYRRLRSEELEDIKQQLKKELKIPSRKKIGITVDGLPIEQYVPVFYSEKKDKSRQNTPYKGKVNVKNISHPFEVERGLNQRHLALWNSHGRYYNHREGQWKWQRAPLFTTVEDLFTSAYVLPFLVPMLEHAGANVYLPRERDVQTNEVVVDDMEVEFEVNGLFVRHFEKGFMNRVNLDASIVNPFALGGFTELTASSLATWHLSVPQNGDYAVYVSYVSLPEASDVASYTVCHAGGETHFSVNQQMGGGTWIYLGHFYFEKDSPAKVTLQGSKKGVVTADAVRIGGGMGSIPREGQLSGVPRWQEAARYYLQYAGTLDSLTFNRHGDTIDYNDDFRSRSRWVNYLKGGDNIEPLLRNESSFDGFGIPIDLSLGIHTDAGHFPSMDTTVGTLAIYSTYNVAEQRMFHDGVSRLANRDFADIVQSQLVADLRALHDEHWTERELWDKMYSEATFAEVPSMLLELHGHANAQDMRFGLDPQFRFDVSRALYKGVLKFLAAYYNEPYVVQPLPVSGVAIKKGDNRFELCWQPTLDSLEKSAAPESYVVYTRLENGGWDNGVAVSDTSYVISVTNGCVSSYKVTAVNKGGESFPSAVLSFAFANVAAPTVLIVDAFSRVSAPFFMESGDSVGVAPWEDEGVAWGTDIATIGWQYDYNQNSPWKSDDVPGHGGSLQNLSDSLFVGNTFDHCYVHASSILAAGFNVVSTSWLAVQRGVVSLADYEAVDIILGEQRSTIMPDGHVDFAIYTPDFMNVVSHYLKQEDAKLLISGAHLATDAMADTTASIMDQRHHFINSLGFQFAGRVSDDCPRLVGVDSTIYDYTTSYNTLQYRVENANALFSDTISGGVLLSFEKGLAAAVYYVPSYRTIAFGVPFESCRDIEHRNKLMKTFLDLLFDE